MGLNIVPVWGRLNEQLIELIDHVPDDRLDWSPNPTLWSFYRLFLHLAEAREQWMTRRFADGDVNTIERDLENQRPGKDELRGALRRTWERVERTIGDQVKLDATYKDLWWKEAPLYDGHWVAFHLLEHDIHHRAEMLMYLAQLGITVRSEWTQTL